MLEALILSRAQDVQQIFRRVLESFGIGVRPSTGAGDALLQLKTHKFDAVVIDCDDLDGGRDVMEAVRKGRSNRNAIVFAVVNGNTAMKLAYDIGANFVLEKPLTAERVQRSVKAAHGLIMRERRRYFRHPVEGDAWVKVGEKGEFKAKIVNLSEGGLLVSSAGHVDGHGAVDVRFQLPGQDRPVEAKGVLCWTDTSGFLGLKFVTFSSQSKKLMDTWLANQHPVEESIVANAMRR